MMKKALFLCLSFLLTISYATTVKQETVLDDAAIQKTILDYMNAYRAKHHRAPLKLVPIISTQAKLHSAEMANKSMSFSHQGFNRRIKEIYKQISFCRGGAENIAYSKQSVREVSRLWTESAGHRQNILGNYNLTGIGIVHAPGGWIYYTQIFIRSDDPAYRG